MPCRTALRPSRKAGKSNLWNEWLQLAWLLNRGKTFAWAHLHRLWVLSCEGYNGTHKMILILLIEDAARGVLKIIETHWNMIYSMLPLSVAGHEKIPVLPARIFYLGLLAVEWFSISAKTADTQDLHYGGRTKPQANWGQCLRTIENMRFSGHFTALPFRARLPKMGLRHLSVLCDSTGCASPRFSAVTFAAWSRCRLRHIDILLYWYELYCSSAEEHHILGALLCLFATKLLPLSHLLVEHFDI